MNYKYGNYLGTIIWFCLFFFSVFSFPQNLTNLNENKINSPLSQDCIGNSEKPYWQYQ